MLKMMPIFGLGVILILLTACGVTPTAVVVADPPTATSAPTPTLVNEATSVSKATSTVKVDTPTPEVVGEEPTEVMEEPTTVIEEPAPTQEPTVAPTEEIDWRAVEGKTADNLTYLGNPDAPVTILDYSDFL